MRGGRRSHDQRSPFAHGHDDLFYATANQLACELIGLDHGVWTSAGEYFGLDLIGGENVHQLQNGRRKSADRRRIENRDGASRTSETQSSLGRRYRNFELRQYDGGRLEGGGAAGDIISAEKFVRSRINNDAVIATRRFDYDEPHSRGRAGRSFYMSNIDAFVAVEA